MSDSLDFSSDTSAHAHPSVLEALAKANSGMAGSYGGDDLTEALRQRVCEVFETDVEILPLVSGTAANALSLSLLCGPTESILCHEDAHIACDERGAPEFFTHGGKLELLSGEHSRIDANTLEARCARIDRSFLHATPPAALSLTNLTETGTVYSASDISALCAIAKTADLSTHLDGARLGNALAYTGASPAEMTWKAGVDILSFGLTKTGAMGCEIICLFGDVRRRIEELRIRAKRAGHLPPKMRYLSAQGLALLDNGLWLELAGRANSHAKHLSESLILAHDAHLAAPVEGNEVFAYIPEALESALRSRGLKAYAWHNGAIRFVCNWDTNKEHVLGVREICQQFV